MIKDRKPYGDKATAESIAAVNKEIVERINEAWLSKGARCFPELFIELDKEGLEAEYLRLYRKARRHGIDVSGLWTN